MKKNIIEKTKETGTPSFQVSQSPQMNLVLGILPLYHIGIHITVYTAFFTK
jgi:hypothetical protein